jgi:hypothetical protein
MISVVSKRREEKGIMKPKAKPKVHLDHNYEAISLSCGWERSMNRRI